MKTIGAREVEEGGDILIGSRSEIFQVENSSTISIGFLMVSLVTIRVSLEEVCLPSFEVLNCWLNLVASYLDDENESPLKMALWCGPRIASLPLPRYVARGD